MPTQIDRSTFLQHLEEANLLAKDVFQDIHTRFAHESDGRLIARKLVEEKILTRFQAEMIVAGRTDGFHLGQYRILDHIGRGGMGRVFKAEHVTMHRVVALKVLAPHLTNTERARQMFQREVRAAAKLNHPNIVTAYDANSVDDRHFLVMEFVNGPNLQQLIKEQGPLPVPVACEFIRQACLGLQHAHELGMVHRDIKPHNLLINRSGPGQFTLKILDFGLARLASPDNPLRGHESIVAAENSLVGTPDYVSPEQARNLHSADIRSDIYSLGCTFYFLLTGQVPFPGGTALEKLLKHGTEEPAPIASFRKDVPLNVITVIQRMMAKSPAARPQTPNEVVQLLSPAVPNPAQTPMPYSVPPIQHPLPSGLIPAATAPSQLIPVAQTVPPPPAAPTSTGDSHWATLLDDSQVSFGTMPSSSETDNISMIRSRSKDTRKHLSIRQPKSSTPFWLVAALTGIILGGSALGCFVAYTIIANSSPPAAKSTKR